MLQKYETDVALIDRLQQSAFSYFLDFTDPTTGLVADTSMPDAPSSIAATGFGLSAYPVGVERGWIAREDAAARTLTTLRFLAESPQSRDKDATGYRGLYYHFLDMKSGRRTWRSELSLIDSALLLAGVITAEAYFSRDNAVEVEIQSVAAMLYARANWEWALDRADTLSLGWKPRSGFLPFRWEGYSEAIILYVLALASPAHPIPERSYAAFAEKFDWMTFRDQPYLYAGPLFIHLFSHAWIDFRDIKDKAVSEKNSDYFKNTRRAIAVQRDHAEKIRVRSSDMDGMCGDLRPATARSVRACWSMAESRPLTAMRRAAHPSVPMMARSRPGRRWPACRLNPRQRSLAAGTCWLLIPIS